MNIHGRNHPLPELVIHCSKYPQCFSSTSFLMTGIEVKTGNIFQCQSGHKMASFRKTVTRKINSWHVYIYAIIFSVTILFLLYALRRVNLIASTIRIVQNSNNQLTHELSSDFQGIYVVIILCNDERRKSSASAHAQNGTSTRRVRRDAGSSRIARDFDRQINQTVVLLKSIAIQQSLSKLENQINILVLSDQYENFQKVEEVIVKERWSVNYLRHLKLTFVPVSYPPGLVN